MTGLKPTGIVFSFLVLVALIILGAAGPAAAHRVRLFATVEGDTIQGYGYFSKSSRTKNCPLIFYGPRGKELGRVMTDGNGEFSYRVRVKCDHKLVLKAGEGHQAEFLIRAGELPDTLGVPQNTGGPAEPTAKAAPKQADPALPPGRAAPSGGTLDPAELSRIVSSAVARETEPLKKQLTALRRQLDEYEAKVRWHDVLGGIGFILGLAGVGLLVMNRRRGGRG